MRAYGDCHRALGAADRGFIRQNQNRQVTVSALVDTGAFTVVVDERTQRRLGLAVTGKRMVTFANGTRQECGLTEPVEIRWNERNSTCKAAVIPGAGSADTVKIPPILNKCTR
jgi:predicted aspartyl protease